MAAHALHYSVLGAGLLGLLMLLGPHLVGQHRYARVRHRYDEHDERVRALRDQLGTGTTLTVTRPTALTHESPVERLLLPLAVVGSASAAGVHAALGPAHWHEQTLFGLFFIASALLQLLWAVTVAVRPTRAVLALGIAGNLGIVAFWLVTRTAGLPWGLLPRPEAVGPWDLACALWELAVVIAAARALSSGEGRLRLSPWMHWSTTAQAGALLSGSTLVLLSLSGAGS